MQDADKSNTTEDKTRKLQPAQETGKSNEVKLPANTTTTIKGILKRPNEEISVNDQQSTVAEDNLDQTKSTATSDETTDSNVEMFDPDDSEQPFPSLTDEEKKIIGLTGCPASGESCSNLAVSENTDLKSPVSNFSTLLSSYNNMSAITSLENNSSDKAVMSYHEGDMKTTDAYTTVKLEEAEEDDSNERIIDRNVKVKEESSEMSVDSRLDCVGESHGLAVTNEKSSKSDKSRKRKSVPLQISDEGFRDKTHLLDTTTVKKRKSQQLPFFANNCSIDPLPVKSEEGSKAVKKNDGCINEATALQQFFMSTSKSTKSDHSKKSVLTNSSQHLKAHKAALNSPVKSEEKSPIKKSMKESVHHQPKKKQNLCETEINFFGPTKKALKIDKEEKQKKSKEKLTSVKTLKVHKTEKKLGTDKSKRIQKTEPKITTVTPITILSSDESDMSSADNLDMNAEEHSSLKRIWDDFELPVQNDSFLGEDSQSPVKKQMDESPRKRMLSTSKETSMDKQPSMANALGLGKKKRVAHTSSHVSRVFGVCVQTLF